MFATMFPITFLANTFAPTDSMPAVLRFIAEWNPISSLAQAVRELWGNDQPARRRRRVPDAAPDAVHHRLDRRCSPPSLAPLAIRTFQRRDG